jgi:thiopeptide-type bacteriocin biosynthesis protein
MRTYHGRFLERYGLDQTVPVLELLDEARGLGCLPPANGSKADEHRPSATKRDRLLGELLFDAKRRGTQEIVLDDAIVRRLSPDGRNRPPRSADVGAEVVAASWEALSAGDFRIVLGLSPISPMAGAAYGRFVASLGAPAESRIQHLVNIAGTTDYSGELAAMVSFRPSVARSANVTNVPQWLPHRIPLGTGPAATSTVQDLSLEHLGVQATLDRLELVWTATGQRVRPVTYSMINPRSGHVPNVARFLIELGNQEEQALRGWSWGTWATAPALPRVTYGRSILCPAHWTPDEQLSATSSASDDSQWTAQIDRWRHQWDVPRHVLLGRGDNRIAVDLDNPLHQHIFRGELRRGSGLAVIECFGGAASNDWFRGPDGSHASEFLFPLLRSDPRAKNGVNPAPPVRREAVRLGGRAPYGELRHLPGGEWLYAKLYVPERHQLAVLTRHLARLTDAASADGSDTWFFIRYADPEAHLRLRFHGSAKSIWSDLLPELRSWAADLIDAGLLARLVLDTYKPEIHRYGGSQAIAHAEQVFHADSMVVLRHLVSQEGQLAGLSDVSLAALGVLDILSHLCTTTTEMLRLLDGTQNVSPHSRVPRPQKQLLCTLMTERGSAQESVIGESWGARRAALVALREILRGDASHEESVPESVGSIAMSLAHMHCNRLLGVDPAKEVLTYATARESLVLRLDRMRHGR